MDPASAGTAAVSGPSVPAGSVFGRWARSAAACRRPELIFERARAVIRAPVASGRTELAYDGVGYARYHRQVKVLLRHPHPYQGAPEGQALLFELDADGGARLQLVGDEVAFVRCP